MPTRRNDHTQPGDAQPGDAITMLQEDHQRVRDLCQEYAMARDPRAQRGIAEEACTELELHAQVEEERQACVEDSHRDHQAMKGVIRA
ncbi:MAG TPA: hypothetical protein VI542_24270 [Candidatus Tectomicrobia bacterium]